MKQPVFYAIGHAIVDYIFDVNFYNGNNDSAVGNSSKKTDSINESAQHGNALHNKFLLPPPLLQDEKKHITPEQFDSVVDSIHNQYPFWSTRSASIMNAGGIATNISRAATLCGAKCKFSGTVGSNDGKWDEDGLFFQQKMAEAGVETELKVVSGRTGRFISIISPIKASAASPGAASQIDLPQIDYQYIADADCVITEGMIFQNIGVFNRLCELCTIYNKVLAIDTSTINLAEKMAISLPKLARSLPLILFANDTESTALRQSGIDSPAMTASNLYPIYINMKSEKGCSASVNGSSFFIPTKKIDAYDTTGAGDTFIGAFLASWFSVSESEQNIHFLKKCLEFANNAASLVLDVPLCTLKKERFEKLSIPTAE